MVSHVPVLITLSGELPEFVTAGVGQPCETIDVKGGFVALWRILFKRNWKPEVPVVEALKPIWAPVIWSGEDRRLVVWSSWKTPALGSKAVQRKLGLLNRFKSHWCAFSFSIMEHISTAYMISKVWTDMICILCYYIKKNQKQFWLLTPLWIASPRIKSFSYCTLQLVNGWRVHVITLILVYMICLNKSVITVNFIASPSSSLRWSQGIIHYALERSIAKKFCIM